MQPERYQDKTAKITRYPPVGSSERGNMFNM